MLRGCSQWGSPAEPEIFSQIIICLFCMRIYCIYRSSYMWTQLSGEYIINFISLLIISIFWFYHKAEVNSGGGLWKHQTWPINPIFWFYHKAEVNSGGGLWKDQTWPINPIFWFYHKAEVNSGGGLEKYQTWPINSIFGFIAKQRSILAVDFGFSANVVNARKRSIAVEIWRDTFLLLCFFPLIIQ